MNLNPFRRWRLFSRKKEVAVVQGGLVRSEPWPDPFLGVRVGNVFAVGAGSNKNPFLDKLPKVTIKALKMDEDFRPWVLYRHGIDEPPFNNETMDLKTFLSIMSPLPRQEA